MSRNQKSIDWCFHSFVHHLNTNLWSRLSAVDRLHTLCSVLTLVTAKWFLSSLCKYMQAISDCGSSSLTLPLYGSSVHPDPPPSPSTNRRKPRRRAADWFSLHASLCWRESGEVGLGAQGAGKLNMTARQRKAGHSSRLADPGRGVYKHLRLLNSCNPVEISFTLLVLKLTTECPGDTV